MKNSDKPATASVFTLGRGNYEETTINTGLTKREHFAGLAMQNILGSYNPYEYGDFDSSDYKKTAIHAVGLADALLKELNNENN